MKLALTKPTMDIGVVVTDAAPMTAFYRDLLGLEDLGAVTVPGFGTFHRLGCGDSTIKLLVPERPPALAPRATGFSSMTGLRYFTLWVSNLDEIVDTVTAAGVPIPVPVRSLGPMRMAMLEDPEGNTVELLEVA